MRYGTSEYHEYLTSREWALLREQVRERSGGFCERCWVRPMQACHHLTYERVGHERLEDLQAICNPCHEYESGKGGETICTYIGCGLHSFRHEDYCEIRYVHKGQLDQTFRFCDSDCAEQWIEERRTGIVNKSRVDNDKIFADLERQQ